MTIGDSSTVTAEARGKAHLQTYEGQIIDLDEVLFIPGFDRNIISLGRFAQKGHHVEMCGEVIKVWSLDKKMHLKFERKENLYYLKASPRDTSDDTVMSVDGKVTKVDINKAHTVLGHLGTNLLEKTAKEIG